MFEDGLWSVLGMVGMAILSMRLLMMASPQKKLEPQLFQEKLMYLTISLVATVCLVAYSLYKGDKVFITGTAVASLYYFCRLISLLYHYLIQSSASGKPLT